MNFSSLHTHVSVAAEQANSSLDLVDILDSAPYGCQLWDENSTIVFCNTACVRMFNLETKQKYLEHFFEFSPKYQPDGKLSVTKARHLVERARAEGCVHFDWLHQDLQGEPFPVEVTLMRLQTPKQTFVAGYFTDLRQVNRLERMLQSRNAELEISNGLLQVVSDAAQILLSSEESTFDTAVNTVLKILCRTAAVSRVYIWQNHVGADGRQYCDQVYEWSENYPPQQGNTYTVNISYDEVIPAWREAFVRGKGINALVREMSPSEQLQLAPQGIVSILVRPIILNLEVWGFIGFDECEKERHWSQAEENILSACGLLLAASIHKHRAALALRQAKDMAEAGTRAKGEFLARMSHEIRTPMNGILGLLYLCLQTELSSTQLDYVTKAQKSAQSLLGIINDILDFSKIEAQKLDIFHKPFSVSGVLDNVKAVVNVKAQEKKLDLTWHIDPKLPPLLMGDALRLHQVLVNLCGNAIKFTEHGSVRVSVSEDFSSDIRMLQLSVHDTGPGLTPEEQSLLFTPFFQMDGSITRRYGGTGLGLVISKQLVELMGGNVSVSSEKNVGSVFSFTIPLIEASPQDHVAPILPKIMPSSLNDYRILLVEDNEINQMIAQQVLEQAGMRVTIATNGEEACTLTAQEHFDAILMDVQMPVMDGLEATRRIRARANACTIPIIAMTANAMNRDRERSLEAGMNDHITKPFEPESLIRVLKKWIRKA